jgi:hypothetical protein
MACSESCVQALAKADRAIDTILGRSAQTAKVSAYVFVLCGVIFILFALYSHWRYTQLRLAHLLAGVMGVAFLGCGVWYYRVGRKGGSE